MKLLEVTCPTPEENLALDETLLETAEAGGEQEWLRIWEGEEPFVVVGRSSRLSGEVRLGECLKRGIPVLRRHSGGAAVVAGRGCLMYAVVLGYGRDPHLRAIDVAHRFVLGRIRDALGEYIEDVRFQGTSDLTLGDLKVSGNSLRCKRDHFLYHGTLLYDFPLELIGICLDRPPRQPGYRAGRAHDEFVTNLPLQRPALRDAVVAAWQPESETAEWPQERVRELVAEKYGRKEWNARL